MDIYKQDKFEDCFDKERQIDVIWSFLLDGSVSFLVEYMVLLLVLVIVEFGDIVMVVVV